MTLGIAQILGAALISVSLIAPAQDQQICGGAPLTEARSLEKLPSQLSSLLGRGRPGVDGLADRDGNFNVTDVVDDKLPMRRFVLGGFNDNCALVAIERGGRGHWFELLTLMHTSGKWHVRSRRSIETAPTSLEELRRHASG